MKFNPIGALFFLFLTLVSKWAWSQADYPNRTIRLICVHAAGGSADALSRVLADRLSKVLNQTVFVENKPGAGTMLGASYVANAPADGYTLLMASVTTLSINPSLYSSMSYHPLKDFATVAMVAQTPSVLAVSPKLNVKNLKELLDLLKANPGRFNYSSPGQGTSAHLAGALFTSMAQVDVVHIPYKASASAVLGLLSGEVQMTFENSLVPYSRNGKLHPIGIASAKRSISWPELPTLAEQGLTGYESTVWYGVVAPSATPPEVVKKLNDAINNVLTQKEMIDTIKNLSGDPVGGSPESFTERIKSDTQKWAKVIKTAGVQAE
jgi:tripartite-type tricarboxylate transporter receptor subunit TctC